MIAQCPVPPPKRNFCQYQRKILEKQKLNVSPCTLFHTKTRVSLKCFVSYCRLIRICRIQCWCYSFILLFLDKPGPKNENCQFRLKFGTQTNSNKQNVMVEFTFSVFIPDTPFLVNEGKRRTIRGVETSKQSAVVNRTFLFFCGQFVRGLFLGTALKIFK